MRRFKYHILAFIVLVIFAALYTSEGFLYRDYNLDEFQVATGYLKDQDPSLFATDFIWSKPEMVRNLHVCVRRLMDFTNIVTAHQFKEPIDLFLIWLPIGFALFFGNYLLSYEFTRNRYSSLLVAICFMIVRRSIYDWWGIGPTFTMSARGIVLCALPLGLWGFLKVHENKKQLAIFCLLWGFLSNFHPLSGWGFMEFLGITILVLERWSARAFAKVAFMALFVTIGSLPFLIVWNKVALIPASQQADPALSKQFLEYYQFIQPATGKYLKGMITDLWLPLMLSISGMMIVRRRAEYVRDSRLQFAFVFPIVVVATVVGIVVLGLIWKKLGFGVPVMATEHARNLKLVYVTLPIWMAFAFQTWLQKRINSWLKASVIAVVLLIALSINFPGHKAIRYFLATNGLLTTESRLRFEDGLKNDKYDLDLSMWAKNSTPREALFYFDSYEFRYYARRSLVFCSFDRPCVAFHPSHEMKEWNDRLERVVPLKKDQDIHGMEIAAKDYQADFLVTLNEWGDLGRPPVWKNDKYSVFAISNSR